jgi:hypothetical protein
MCAAHVAKSNHRFVTYICVLLVVTITGIAADGRAICAIAQALSTVRVNKYDSSIGNYRPVGIFSNNNWGDFSPAYGYVPGQTSCAYNTTALTFSPPPWCDNWMGISCRNNHVNQINIQGVSWTKAVHVPTAIAGLKSLQSLQLTNVGLNGPIPSAVGQMNSLTFLDLSNNILTGAVPPLSASLRRAAQNYNFGLDNNCNLTSTDPSIASRIRSPGQCQPPYLSILSPGRYHRHPAVPSRTADAFSHLPQQLTSRRRASPCAASTWGATASAVGIWPQAARTTHPGASANPTGAAVSGTV